MDGNEKNGMFSDERYVGFGCYPWTVIPVEERDRYMEALEAASVDQDINPFAEFVAWLVEEGMKGKPVSR